MTPLDAPGRLSRVDASMEIIGHDFLRPDWERIEDALHDAWRKRAARGQPDHAETLALRRLWLVVRETVLDIKDGETGKGD